MIKVQPWLVTGVGGSRIDFIAGWLSCLPGFVNNHWSIDPHTGQSVGEMRLMKSLDYDPISLKEHLERIGRFAMADDHTIKFCGSVHGYNLERQIADDDNAVVLYIKVPDHRLSKVHWEFCVKTYLTNKFIGNIHDLTDAAFIERKIAEAKRSKAHEPHPKAHILDYEQLFVHSGSRYLCAEMGIEAPDRLHDFYDDMLKWADSPLEIEAYGKVWRFSDYFES